MSSRYYKRRQKVTRGKEYNDILEPRDRSRIKHYTTPKINHPTSKQREQMTQHVHIWKEGDRFYKLAYEHYGDSRYWWVIAHWNLRPTEAHVSIGEGLRIPGPIGVVLSILNKGVL
tara:strand:+ start:281 stop:628 length:348 start_codon:yes stop_codon:yes gene_type:complete